MSAHHDEQQELENAKYLWRKGGKWICALLIAAAIGYLGKVVYLNHQQNHAEQAAAVVVQVGTDQAKLIAIQQQFPHMTATAQASLQAAAAWYQAGQYDDAAKAYQWVLDNNKTPVFQAAAAQYLANVYLQQKKYDEALKVVATPVDASYQPLLNEVKGDILVAQGKNKEAVAAYQLAMDKLPEDAPNRELLQLKIGQL